MKRTKVGNNLNFNWYKTLWKPFSNSLSGGQESKSTERNSRKKRNYYFIFIIVTLIRMTLFCENRKEKRRRPNQVIMMMTLTVAKNPVPYKKRRRKEESHHVHVQAHTHIHIQPTCMHVCMCLLQLTKCLQLPHNSAMSTISTTTATANNKYSDKQFTKTVSVQLSVWFWLISH